MFKLHKIIDTTETKLNKSKYIHHVILSHWCIGSSSLSHYKSSMPPYKPYILLFCLICRFKAQFHCTRNGINCVAEQKWHLENAWTTHQLRLKWIYGSHKHSLETRKYGFCRRKEYFSYDIIYWMSKSVADFLPYFGVFLFELFPLLLFFRWEFKQFNKSSALSFNKDLSWIQCNCMRTISTKWM